MSVVPSCLPVFLYGPLRPGSTHPYAALLASRCRLLGTARMKGRLFRHGTGFAATHEPDGGAEIVGEVIELPETGADQILDSLDRYEGIGTGLPGPPAFVRQRIPVLLAGQLSMECWTWIYRGPLETLVPVKHGDALPVMLRP